MCKADFTHSLELHRNRTKVIVIEDLDLGNKSVTNDIENVVADIAKMEKIDPLEYMIVYKDSTGSWDGWDHREFEFIGLGEETWWDAVSKWKLRIADSAVKSLATS